MPKRLILAFTPSAQTRALGFGLVELMVALLLFTLGAAGLVTAQLSGQRATHVALQRSVATTILVDVLARIEANPVAVANYVIRNLSAETDMQPPAIDCRQHPCNPPELATFDLWQLHQSLQFADHRAKQTTQLGQLPQARVCIEHSADTLLTIAISWLGQVVQEASTLSQCGSEEERLFDAPMVGAGNNLLRRQVVITTYMGSV